MVTKAKAPIGPARKEWPGDLGQPIVVPFRGVPGNSTLPLLWESSDDSPGRNNADDSHRDGVLTLDGFPERLKKLFQLADHYGIKRNGDPGWELLLAYRIACELHPGFELVYDQWEAKVFKSLYGFTPFHQTKEGDNPSHRPKGTGWAPSLVPEFVALLADTIGKGLKLKDKKFTNKWLCELMAISFDPELKKPSNRTEREKKTATLMRRLSEGRRRKKT